MLNPYNPKIAKIIKVTKQTPDTNLFTLRYMNKKDREDFGFNHGQFIMAGLAGFGEAPFAICSNVFDTSVIELSIREVGDLTKALNRLVVGDKMLLRGPYGHGFPHFKKFTKSNLLLIGGGCGFVILKSIIEDYLKNYKNKFKAQALYGATDENHLLFKDCYKRWQEGIDLQIILDKPQEKWKWKKGVITKLFKEVEIIEDATVIICGPPVMYRFVIKELKNLKFSPSDIYLSLERRIHCGLGVCHHCAIGSKLVCKDGPVFRYDEIKDIKDAI
jgi:NAD(P)H-flavin reductase